MFLSVSLSFVYSAIAIFNLYVMYHTGTRGSFVGILGGLCLTALLWAIAEREYKIFRWVGIVSIMTVAIVVITLGSTKNTEYVKSHNQLNRFAQLITLDPSKVLEDQGHARTLLWKMSYEGVKERPLLGWGQDNFGYVFAKYYDPAMYAQEQWFDRTHDVFFDWLIAAGFLGLIAYLSLFVSAIYTLWRKGDDNWSASERAVITGMLIAYFIHNIFVFDNLASYIFFFTTLAFINTRVKSQDDVVHKTVFDSEIVWLIDIASVVLFGYVMLVSVISPYNSSAKLIEVMQGKKLVTSGSSQTVVDMDPKERFEEMKSILSANDLTRSEARERLADISVEIMSKTVKTDRAFTDEVYKYTVDQYNKEFESTKTDPRPYFFYSIFQQKIGDISGSLNSINKAVELSPTKQSFLFNQAQTLIMLNKKEEGLAVFKKSYELDKTNIDALKYYVYDLIENNKKDEALKLLDAQSSVQII